MNINILKAILAGTVVWLLVITTFTLLTYVSGINQSMMMQSLIVVLLMTCYASVGSWIYYRKTAHDHGVWVGACAAGIALLLDVLVTVPFVEIPNGGSYGQFFSSPVLWVLVIINIATFYVYGKRRGAALKDRV